MNHSLSYYMRDNWPIQSIDDRIKVEKHLNIISEISGREIDSVRDDLHKLAESKGLSVVDAADIMLSDLASGEFR